MNPFQVTNLNKELTVRFSNKTVVLPGEIQEKIDRYWQSLLDSGKSYRRGEVFTVTHVDEQAESIEILVEKSDYAHYLYCQNIDSLGEYGVRIIHTAVLVLTTDNKVVFGKMGAHTARAGIFQLCGGGIDLNNLRGDIFDFDHNISNELGEELGIDVQDTLRVRSFTQKYLKPGGPTDKMTVIYEINLNESEVEFRERYEKFAQELRSNAENPEFDEIISLAFDDTQGAARFFEENGQKCDEYMKPLFDFINSH